MLSECVKDLAKSGVIHIIKSGEKVTSPQSNFLSPYFLIEKPNKNPRFILNLKQLNSFLPQIHFKMEPYRTVLKLIQEGSYMCNIDLKQAYYIPFHQEFRKYLSFKFDDPTYHYCALPFDLSLAPYIFTKVTKPILSYLRSKNVTCVLYLDDFLIINTVCSKAQCDTNLVLNTLVLVL